MTRYLSFFPGAECRCGAERLRRVRGVQQQPGDDESHHGNTGDGRCARRGYGRSADVR
jgi:hypothetical protein